MVDAIATPAPDIVAAEAPPTGPLPARTKFLMATGDLVDGIVNGSLNTFLLLYLTAVCGLSGSQAGLALALALTIDAFADPLIGFASDNTVSRWGRRHPYVFASILPLALAFGLLFSVPPVASQWALFAYVTGILIVLRFCHSLFMLPYAAIGAEVTPGYAERSVVMSYRFFLNIAGSLTSIFLGLSVFMAGEGGLMQRDAYVAFGWTCAGILTAGAITAGLSSYAVRDRLMKVRAETKPALARMAREFAEVFRNRSFIVLFLTAVALFTSQGAHISLGLHALNYFWKIPAEYIQYIPVLGALGWIAGVPLSALLVNRVEKRHIAVGGLAIISFGQFLPPALMIAGVLPSAAEASATLVVLLVAFGMVVGAVTCACGIALGSMMMDAADEHEYLFGQRREGTYFAGLSLSVKASAGLGILLAGASLDLIGFPSDLVAAGRAAEIAPDVARNVGLVQGPGAALVTALSAVILSRYRIGKRELAEMQQALHQRRGD
jgi:GPH family glycoside/pentoside/hexuronide:cation symporter